MNWDSLEFGFETKSFADKYLQSLTEQFGFPTDQLKYLLCLLFSFPAAIVLRYLPSTTSRHVFTLVVGLFYCIFCFGNFGWFHPALLSTIVYVILKALPISFSYKIAVVFSFTYLLLCHCRRAIISASGFDITGPMMLLTIKTVSIAFNYSDGQKSQDSLRDEWRQNALKTLPGLLEYYAHCFCFLNLLVGPTSEFMDYKKYTNRTMFQREIPPSGTQTIVKIGQALGALILMVSIAPNFGVSYLTSQAFEEKPLWIKYIITVISVFSVRCGYYFVWRLAEGAHILSGFAYNGMIGKDASWDRVENVEIMKIEFIEAPRNAASYWNIRTGNWIKNYIYLRPGAITDKNPVFAMYLANLVSALWHGFYSGYYFCFIYFALMVDVNRKVRRVIRSRLVSIDSTGKEIPKQPFKMIYDVVGMITTIIFINYGVAAAPLLHVEPILVYLKAMQYSGHLIMLAFLVVITVIDSLDRKNRQKVKKL